MTTDRKKDYNLGKHIFAVCERKRDFYMKRIFALILALTMCLSLCACFSEKESGGEVGTKEGGADTKQEEKEEPKTVMETENVRVDGVYLDESYVDSSNAALKMMYLFLTLKAKDTNLKYDCKYTKIQIGNNQYETDFFKGGCDYMPNYYYSSFIKDLYVGEEIKIALTAKVAKGEFESEKEITLNDTDMPVAGLKFRTTDVVRCATPEEIGQKADSEGCAEVLRKQEPADAELEKKVRKAINGYYFTFYVSLGSKIQTYKLEFSAPNKFELKTPLLSNSGTYTVKNGYVSLAYKTNPDKPIDVAYEFNEKGEIVLHCAEAFSIYE